MHKGVSDLKRFILHFQEEVWIFVFSPKQLSYQNWEASVVRHRLLNRWTSQLELGCTTGWGLYYFKKFYILSKWNDGPFLKYYLQELKCDFKNCSIQIPKPSYDAIIHEVVGKLNFRKGFYSYFRLRSQYSFVKMGLVPPFYKTKPMSFEIKVRTFWWYIVWFWIYFESINCPQNFLTNSW